METRRAFSRTTIAAAAGTALSASRVWGANDRVRMGLIGSGGRGREDWGNFLKQPEVEPVAVCDVYDPHREQGIALTEGRAKPFKDFRRLLEERLLQLPFDDVPVFEVVVAEDRFAHHQSQ